MKNVEIHRVDRSTGITAYQIDIDDDDDDCKKVKKWICTHWSESHRAHFLIMMCDISGPLAAKTEENGASNLACRYPLTKPT